jgi:hypothetical protein
MDVKALLPLALVFAIGGPAWGQDEKGADVDPYRLRTPAHRDWAAPSDVADPSTNPYDVNVPDNPYDLAPATGGRAAAPYGPDALSRYGRDPGENPSNGGDYGVVSNYLSRPGAGAEEIPYSAAPSPYASSPYALSPYAPSPYAPSPYVPSPYVPSPYAPSATPPSDQSAAIPSDRDAAIQGGMSGLDQGLGGSLTDPLVPPPPGAYGGASSSGSVAPNPYTASKLKSEQLEQDSSGALGFNPYDAKSLLAPAGQSGNLRASDPAKSLSGTALAPAPASQGAATSGASLTGSLSGSLGSALPSTLGSPIGPSVPGAPAQ